MKAKQWDIEPGRALEPAEIFLLSEIFGSGSLLQKKYERLLKPRRTLKFKEANGLRYLPVWHNIEIYISILKHS